MSQDNNPYGRSTRALASIDDYVRGIANADSKQINICLWQARQDPTLFGAVLSRLSSIPQPSNACRYAFHLALTEQGPWMRDCFSIDPVLVPALANLLPGYNGPPMRLFRGERWSNYQNKTYGFSWTTSRKVAEAFARELNALDGDGGVLLQTTAPADAILAEPHDDGHYVGDDEYIVDRRRLTAVEVIARFSS